MRWALWIVVVLVVLNGGWMLFDGARGLIVGDYVRPTSGEHAGQLGPWAGLVSAVGIDPESTLMKSIFVAYGAAYLATLGAFVAGADGSRRVLGLIAVLGLWYLPFGTIINTVVIVLLRTRGPRAAR